MPGAAAVVQPSRSAPARLGMLSASAGASADETTHVHTDRGRCSFLASCICCLSTVCCSASGVFAPLALLSRPHCGTLCISSLLHAAGQPINKLEGTPLLPALHQARLAAALQGAPATDCFSQTPTCSVAQLGAADRPQQRQGPCSRTSPGVQPELWRNRPVCLSQLPHLQ